MTPTLKRKFVLNNAEGLHARPATTLVKIANEFNAKLHLLHGNERVDLKSIMGVLSLGVPQGSEVVIEAVGDDADRALIKIIDFLNQLNLKK